MTANTTNIVSSYKELVVWQRSMELVDLVYNWTATFPVEERYGLVSQMRRSGVSIPSNIAEGRRRHTKKDFVSFLNIAFGSVAELETQCEIAHRRKYGNNDLYEICMRLLDEISRMLNSMITKLRSTSYKLQATS